MNINSILKTAILEQYGLPLIASSHETGLSYIVRRRGEPSPEKRKVVERGLPSSLVQRREIDESSRT